MTPCPLIVAGYATMTGLVAIHQAVTHWTIDSASTTH